MADNSKVVRSFQTAEYGKFIELSNNTTYPPVSVTRWSYPDTTSAFPGNSAVLPLSSVEIYPKYAILTQIANPEDISVSLSAGNLNVNIADVESLIAISNSKLDALTAQDYSTSANQDRTNTLLDLLTAKETTISLDVSAINLNTDEIEGKLDLTNTLLDNLTGNVLDIEGLINTNNLYTNYLPSIASFTNETYNWAYNSWLQLLGVQSNTSDIRNSLFNGIGGYSLGGYFNSYNSLLSSIDVTLRTGLNVTGGGGGGTFTDAPVKKLASDTLVSSFTAPSASRIYNIFGVSTANIGQYLQIYDVAGSTPSGTPSGIFFVPANSNFNFEFVKGMPFTNNKALIVNSITPVDYNGGNSDLFITVIYN